MAGRTIPCNCVSSVTSDAAPYPAHRWGCLFHNSAAHEAQRWRRLAQNPSLLGLGVDEDTAGVVGPDGVLEVIGRGSVTVVDGAASETDAWEVRGHRPLMISGVVLHSLPAGYRFDVRRRHRVTGPSLTAIQGGPLASS